MPLLSSSSTGSSSCQVSSAARQPRAARPPFKGFSTTPVCPQQNAVAPKWLQSVVPCVHQQAEGSPHVQAQLQQHEQDWGQLQDHQQQVQHQQEHASSPVLQQQHSSVPPGSHEAPRGPQGQFITSAVQQQEPQLQTADLKAQQQITAVDSTAAADTQSLPAQDAGSTAGDSPSEPPAPTLAQKFTFFYTPVNEAITSPVPVQVPPPDASTAPVKPFFNTKKYRPPSFLQHYAAPAGSSYNFLSFLGDFDPNKGKFLAVGDRLEAFLTSYYRTVALANRRMFMAESYQGKPFKLYQELDFPWLLDPQLVLALIPRVVDILSQEVSCVYEDQITPGTTPQIVLSMRTIYKVHLNFPGINTMEAKARVLRKAVINRCRAELSGQPPLDMLKAELVVQEHWQEAQDQLLRLQQLIQQLEGKGQQIPPEAQKILQNHQDLLKSAQHITNSSSSTTATSGDSHTQLPSSSTQLQQQQQQQQLSAQQQQQQQYSESPWETSKPQLSLQEQQQQLDWESIVDFPHGSLRLLGSCKAPWMDSDPEWVTEKAYSRAEYVGGVWMRLPLTLASVMECSIQLQEEEHRVFEQTEEFLEVTFQAAQQREQVLAAKRVKRAAKRQLDYVQQLLLDPEQQQQQSDTTKLSQEDKALKAQLREQRRLKHEARLAAEAAAKAEQEQKRAEALARLRASQAASMRPVLQRPALSRPAVRRPPPPLQPPVQPPQSF